MKYFYDTEFLEGTQKSFLGQSKPTIDLISIGIVAEDGREYYAISKDFNLKEAWNRFDLKHEKVSGDMRNQFPNGITKKVYWIRENVLKPIYEELVLKESKITNSLIIIDGKRFSEYNFTYSNLKRLLKKYGKTNKQISIEVQEFVYGFAVKGYPKENTDKIAPKDIQLYGYYSAYDHVALCWLFGKMIDLPKGFPKYTIDLKQSFDEKAESFTTKQLTDFQYGEGFMTHDVYEPLNYMKVDYTKIDLLKKHKNYPKQTNEHNALSDAKWNFELYKFIQTL